MDLWATAKSDAVKRNDTTLEILDEDDEDEDYVITHFADAWAFLTNSHAY
jgi:hypothetical protein